MTHRTADPIEPFTCSACSYAAVTPRSFASHTRQAHPQDSAALRLDAYTDASAGPDACWLWTGSRDSKGYARLLVDRRPLKVARLLLGIEDDGPEVYACHTCDVPACVNPSHLYAGTHRDNTRDAVVRGRTAHGQRVATARLNVTDVHAIRAGARRGVPAAELARQHGVGHGTIRHVLCGRTWRRVPDLAWLVDDRPAPRWEPCPEADLPARLAALYRAADRVEVAA